MKLKHRTKSNVYVFEDEASQVKSEGLATPEVWSSYP